MLIDPFCSDVGLSRVLCACLDDELQKADRLRLDCFYYPRWAYCRSCRRIVLEHYSKLEETTYIPTRMHLYFKGFLKTKRNSTIVDPSFTKIIRLYIDLSFVRFWTTTKKNEHKKRKRFHLRDTH